MEHPFARAKGGKRREQGLIALRNNNSTGMESDDSDSVDLGPVTFNFPPKGADRFLPSSPNLREPSPSREELSVDGIYLGTSKEKVLWLLGEPTDLEVDEDDGSEWWKYEGPYGFEACSFCRSADESAWLKTHRTLELCFVNSRACHISGGTLKLADTVIAQAGSITDDRVYQLGNPSSENRPLPPYYQNIFWEGASWTAWIESERAVIRVRISEPWWPPQEEDDQPAPC